MTLLGNIIWFVLGGWLLFILYTIAAIIFFPVFLPIFRIARYSLFPFGRSVVYQKDLTKYRELTHSKSEDGMDTNITKSGLQNANKVLNLIWVLTFGWILALTHLLSAVANVFFFSLSLQFQILGVIGE